MYSTTLPRLSEQILKQWNASNLNKQQSRRTPVVLVDDWKLVYVNISKLLNQLLLRYITFMFHIIIIPTLSENSEVPCQMTIS